MTASKPASRSTPLRRGYKYDEDEAFSVDPHARWTELQREYGRAFKSDAMPDWDVWYFLQYEDIKTAFQRADLFSSRQIVPHAPIVGATLIPEMLDPPEHGKYRHLLAAAFSPAAVAARQTEIRDLCVELVDNIADKGRCDLDADFARLFPTTVFLRWMGLDEDQIADLLPSAYAMFQSPDQGGAGEQDRSQFVMGHVAALVEDRRRHPRTDLVSHLLSSEVDGRPLQDDELFAMVYLLYVAGLDTVAGELGYAFLTLAEDPELQRRVGEEPAIIPGLVEELLRLHGLAVDARVVTADVDFAGCPLKEGDRIVLPTAAANLDEGAFPDALTLLPDRLENRHITFGAGPHRCLGSHLARFELTVALEEWHKRIPTYRLAPGARETLRHKLGAVTGLLGLPLEWMPTPG